MENDERQQAILAELRLIRRDLRVVLFILTCGVVLAVLMTLSPQLGRAVTFFAALLALVFLICTAMWIGIMKAMNKLKR